MGPLLTFTPLFKQKLILKFVLILKTSVDIDSRSSKCYSLPHQNPFLSLLTLLLNKKLSYKSQKFEKIIF